MNLNFIKKSLFKTSAAWAKKAEALRSISLTRTIVSMARNFELERVAERVENVDQLEFLKKTGCDPAQGYLFGKLTVFDNLVEHLAEQKISSTA